MPKLTGKKEIAAHLGISWPSVVKLQAQGLPIKKISGTWFSHTDSLDKFFRQAVESQVEDTHRRRVD